MKLTVLVDNHTITDKYYYGEPALSFFIEHDNKKILFDAGYSDIFLKNAEIAKVNLANLDYIVISHGHYDHTGGLEYLSQLYKQGDRPSLIAHKDAFHCKMEENLESIGSPSKESTLSKTFKLELTEKPRWITDNIVFLGEIPRKESFELNKSIGYLPDKNNQKDMLLDDSALAINTEKGIIIITGCSHSGIVNICEYAKEVCLNSKILSIIGGLHLLETEENQINETIKYLKSLNLDSLYACHCTGFKAQCLMHNDLKLKEVGSGLEIKM